MSRNPPELAERARNPFRDWRGVAALLPLLAGLPVLAQPFSLDPATNQPARVVVVENRAATEAFQARPGPVTEMFQQGLLALTQKTNVTDAWATLVTTQDVIGLKVYSRPGPNSGTRPALVAAVARSLIAAGLPARNLVIWDREEAWLRQAGFDSLAEELGVRLAGATKAGWDATNYYDSPIISSLVFGDLEFGSKAETAGRRSYVSRLVSSNLTKIINLTPLLNHNQAGVCGNLYSLAVGCTDNVFRFEDDRGRLATAVPEIYALPAVGDKVVLNLTDALICQYEGGDRSLLHYSTMLNQVRLSRDPVALDLLSLKELETQRRKAKAPNVRPNLELYRNAALLELGVADPARIQVVTLP